VRFILILASLTVALDLGLWLMPKRPTALALTYGLGGIALSGALLMQGPAADLTVIRRRADD
jgi:hypothetical protein